MNLKVVQSDKSLTEPSDRIAGTTTAVQHGPPSCLFLVDCVTGLRIRRRFLMASSVHTTRPKQRFQIRPLHFRKAPFSLDKKNKNKKQRGFSVDWNPKRTDKAVFSFLSGLNVDVDFIQRSFYLSKAGSLSPQAHLLYTSRRLVAQSRHTPKTYLPSVSILVVLGVREWSKSHHGGTDLLYSTNTP